MYDDIGSVAAISKAEAQNQQVVLPSENELFVDLDGEEAVNKFNQQLPRISKYLDITYELRPSPSGEQHRYHVYCKLPRAVSPMERILLQLLLGSDPIREFLSWALVTKGDPNPTLFFEKKEAIKERIRDISFEEANA
jgi:hypothetical protein